MTSLVAGAKRLVGRGSDLNNRIEALRQAAEASRGRVDEALVDETAAVAGRAAERLRLSGDHTVVALAGATGSGKSSTFNAINGLDLAAVGVRRPTTSWTTACAWGADGAGELLDWLGVPKRHQVARNSMLDGPREDRELEGLVLLDLPDHDSTEVSHHLEVDRLVQLTDLLVWVLDPQKYADAAVHDRYLRPLASHRDVILIVLNHIDTVPEPHRAGMVADLRRLLAEDGLEDVPVIPISAKRGDGIPELKQAIAERVAAKKATNDRLLADVRHAAERLRATVGENRPSDVSRSTMTALVDTLAEAAGVPTVVRAVEDSTRRRAAHATGWPVTSWLSRLKPDPLKRLHLDLGDRGKELTAAARTSIPEPTPVQRARVDTAVRAVAEDVGAGMTRQWSAAVRRASVSRFGDLNDALDKAVTGTDLGVSRTPLWWRLVRGLQWLLVLAALTGGLWLGVLAVFGYLRLPAPRTPDYLGFPVPTLLLLGGVVVGVVLALLCRVFVRVSARAKARSADRRLRTAIAEVTERLVIEPIDTEVTAYRTVQDGVRVAGR